MIIMLIKIILLILTIITLLIIKKTLAYLQKSITTYPPLSNILTILFTITL